MDAVIFNMISTLSSTQSVLFATIMWSIWKRRNLKLWNKKNETNAQVLTRATTLLKDG